MTLELSWRELERDPESAVGHELTKLLAHLPWWADHLPQGDRALFVAELGDAFRECHRTGHWAEFGYLLSAWRATGETWADPDVMAALTGPFGDYGPVPEPPRQ